MSLSSPIVSSTVARPVAFDPRSVMAILETQQAAERLRADESVKSAGAVMSVIAEFRQIIQEQAASIRNLEDRYIALGAELANKELLHKAETAANRAEIKALKEQLCDVEVSFQTHIHPTHIGYGHTWGPVRPRTILRPDSAYAPVPIHCAETKAKLKAESAELAAKLKEELIRKRKELAMNGINLS